MTSLDDEMHSVGGKARNAPRDRQAGHVRVDLCGFDDETGTRNAEQIGLLLIRQADADTRVLAPVILDAELS